MLAEERPRLILTLWQNVLANHHLFTYQRTLDHTRQSTLTYNVVRALDRA